MKTRSLLRKLEYARLSRLVVDGRILDVGGSKRSGYLELIGGTHTVEVGNIDASYEVDTVFDAEEPWPYENGSFDGVLFINLLEHLYQPQRALDEARRVLKADGVVVGVVPFMYNVHGSPDDYFRYTDAALSRLFADARFTRVSVEPLGSGVFSMIYQSLLGFVRWFWLAALLKPVFVGLDRLLARLRPGNGMGVAYMPLGYYFEARP
jgi:SAM-dependent methyltransferase